MTLLDSFDFRFNKDASEYRLKFPDMATQSFVFSIPVGDSTYTVKTFWNTWANSPTVNIYDQNSTIISGNMALMPQITDYSPNYLSNSLFEGYYLFWNVESEAFLFYEDD